jgi:hypothetical protein
MIEWFLFVIPNEVKNPAGYTHAVAPLDSPLRSE